MGGRICTLRQHVRCPADAKIQTRGEHEETLCVECGAALCIAGVRVCAAVHPLHMRGLAGLGHYAFCHRGACVCVCVHMA
jgi:hypothetical protein